MLNLLHVVILALSPEGVFFGEEDAYPGMG
jgi:hypothetical protein